MACVGFLGEGTGACVWWMRWVLSLWWTGPRPVVCFGVSVNLLLFLGRLSANGWGYVSGLLVVWHGVSSAGPFWSLNGAWS